MPGGPVVRTWCFHCHSLGLIPGWGTKSPQAAGHGQKKKSLGKKFYEKRSEIIVTLYVQLLHNIL